MGIIRLFLALCVVIGHTEPIMGIHGVGGRNAVQAFYMISGFYMSLILNEKYLGKDSYKIFITNRWLRLYPIYFVLICIIFIYSSIRIYLGLTPPETGLSQFIEHQNLLNPSTWIYLVLTNILLLGQDTVHFLQLNPNGGLGFTHDFWQTNPPLWRFLLIAPAWTIGVELLFYIIAPFILRRRLVHILGLIAVSLGIRLFLMKAYGLTNDPWNYRFFPSELLFFLLGNLAYRFYKSPKMPSINKTQGGILVAGILLFSCFFTPNTPKWLSGFYLITILISIPFLFQWSKDLKWDNFTGEFSYPVYLSHMFIATILIHLNWQIPRLWGLLTCFFSLILSYLLSQFVAIPIEKIRQKRVA